MFRLRHFLPNPQLFFRISPPSSRNSHIANVRQVKFKRPWIRKFLSSCLLYGTAFHLWSSFVLLQFDDTLHDVDEVEESQSGNKRSVKDTDENRQYSEEATDADPIFIPLGWPRLRKGELYVASDPEWKEFAKISRDREKLQALRGGFFARVFPAYADSCRGIDIRCTEGCLSVKYASGCSRWPSHRHRVLASAPLPAPFSTLIQPLGVSGIFLE
jgi:hypothetical protein